ncbi:MAG: tRNA (guanosine(46)-N7)-methyltransferase TrmB [Rhodospirillaceae bacterium]|nr:tRNA (guanosine(46)-N7)-methyltransferase TrmB [Rhodospirillaceae bacterium]
MNDSDHPRRLHGRKRGRKLRAGLAELVDTLLPRLTLRLPQPPQRLDVAEAFGGRAFKDLWVEIGFGAGEHLAWQARTHAEVALIGCEPFVNGIATLLRDIDAEDLGNIRIYPDDGRDLLDTLPDAAVGRVFLLFSDPWPKRRHWQRRVISPPTLATLARVMRPGAELRIASDDPRLLDWTLWHLRAHPGFAWTARSAADFLERPADWPPTRYEQKQIRGRPAYLTFVRTAVAQAAN